MIRADFDPVVFNREALAVWYAFWGDTTARPIYADISKEFDSERNHALGVICAETAVRTYSFGSVTRSTANGTGVAPSASSSKMTRNSSSSLIR